jgi:hypothetical protein
MPCSFGLLPHPRPATGGQPTGLLEVTVTVRCIPLVTAAYGTWVARPVRMTTLPPDGDGSQLVLWVRPVLGDHRLAAKSRRVGELEAVCRLVLSAVVGTVNAYDVRFSYAEGDRSCLPGLISPTLLLHDVVHDLA